MNNLTGNKRYRIHKSKFAKPMLVLQVEYSYPTYLIGSGRYKIDKGWRDATAKRGQRSCATVEDITEGNVV